MHLLNLLTIRKIIMKTNTLGKVKMQSSVRPRSRFDLTHNVNTTFGFGETQPLSCRLLVPGTKSICSNESLIRLAPMVSPLSVL